MPTETVYCSRHPKVATALTCTRCATPICPDCFVPGAVGMLCKKCAALGSSPLYQIRPERFVLAVLAGMISGAIASFVLQFVGFYIFFIAPAIGGVLGQIVLIAVGYKRGIKVEYITGVSIVGGAAACMLLTHANLLRNPIQFVAVALVAAAAIARVRW